MNDELRGLCDPDGLFLRRDVLAMGGTDRTIARALRAGAIHRVRHGAFVFADLWAALDARQQHLLRARAVLRRAGTKVVFSHVTAVALHGAPLWDLSLEEVHVTRVDGAAGRRVAGVVQHAGLLGVEDVQTVEGVLVTSPTRTALDLVTIAGVQHALPVLDHFLHEHLTSRARLRRGADAMNRWAGTLGMMLAVALADGRRESVGESRTSYLFWRQGLPAPVPQLTVHDEHGLVVAHLDFAWPELGVYLEFDGKEKYLKYRREGESVVDAVLREKKREELVCRLTGWRCIRIVWADLYRPEATAAYIRSVLAGGPVHR